MSSSATATGPSAAFIPSPIRATTADAPSSDAPFSDTLSCRSVIGPIVLFGLSEISKPPPVPIRSPRFFDQATDASSEVCTSTAPKIFR